MTSADAAAPTRPARNHWPMRDYPSVFWLVAALAVALTHRWLPSARWLLVHLLLLGALSHAVIVWSTHFCEAILRSPHHAQARRHQSRRIALLLAGSAAVLMGVPTGWWPLTVTGAGLVIVAVGWHGWALATMMRRALPGRFRITVLYYIAAATSLVIGAGLGATLASVPDDPWHGRLLLAHTMANLLGWVGLTVTGTLLTFWPTLLRTRIDEHAERWARQGLPVLIAGVLVVITGALVGERWLAVVGLVGYLIGLGWWGRGLLAPLRARPPREFASGSVGAALGWALTGLVCVAALLVGSGDWAGVTAGFAPVAIIFAIGMGAQLLVGALSYLVPMVLGGGPSAVRASLAWFNRGATVRLVTLNLALPLVVLPVSPAVQVMAQGAVAAALAGFLPLMAFGIRAGLAARTADTAPVPPVGQQPPAWSSGGLVAALGVISVVVTLGVALDPSAAGYTPNGQLPRPGATASSTGHVVRVQVRAHDMTFTPNQISVQPGDRLVIELVNDDPVTVHDLSIAGRATPRLIPGERAQIDLGVISESLKGWCTIAGHRQMGMVLDVLVSGQAGADQSGPATDTHHAGPVTVPNVPDAALGSHVDPTLAPLGPERVHRLTLTVTEVPLEVAPGVWQRRWTFNGQSVGPMLHGRVGDVFEITLVNDGTMGHSIDFHAGELAPDAPMRTIPPGESLVYRFTANRAGVWMYHCSTHPMSAHIAAGMHGAVVIEPDELPEVERSYVLVQSEVYLSGPTEGPGQAAEVAADKVTARQPDRVVFNGIANQYDQVPFEAKVGERVRFWVLDAGPNQPSSFHIVGGQFDTVYLEGAYRLLAGRDAFGQTSGGAQGLGLLPAQGGFVELVFPEAGHYPVVSHIMSDAEIGAHGIVRVS